MSPASRRRAVTRGMERHDMSERHACELTGQYRSTQRLTLSVAKDELRLLKDMRRFSGRHPRFGYRRIHRMLLREGWRINRKRVHRLWRREGMQVPRKRIKRRSLGDSANSCVQHRAEFMNHVWTYDFLFDRTEDGRQVKVLAIVDEFTRECLATHVARSIKAKDVIDVLADVMAERGSPAYIRSDNGPEFIATAVTKWLKTVGTGTLFVEPGSPWENGYIESFNSRLRDELLNGELFIGLAEARYLIEDWRVEYNTDRPHSALNYRTPREFAACCSPSDSASLRLRANSTQGCEAAPLTDLLQLTRLS